MNFFTNLIKIFIFYILFVTSVYSQTIDKILIEGNNRVSNNAIQMFSKIELKDQISNNKLNLILKNLYETNFFEDVKVLFENNTLLITVKEYPIIQKINYNGVKSKHYLKPSVIINLLEKNLHTTNLF
jgi:outer membrane protein insertion porin family